MMMLKTKSVELIVGRQCSHGWLAFLHISGADTLTTFVLDLSFQGGLCSKQLGKLERVPLPGAKGRHSYFPYERVEFAKLRIRIPLLQPTT